MEYTAVFEKMDNGWYFAQCEQMPNAITQGRNIADAKKNLQEVIGMLLDIQKTALPRHTEIAISLQTKKLLKPQ